MKRENRAFLVFVGIGRKGGGAGRGLEQRSLSVHLGGDFFL